MTKFRNPISTSMRRCPWSSAANTAAPAESVTTMAEYINSRATTIYGGTAEIQRGIIAKHVLGL